MDYLRDPEAIYRESFAAIRREVDLTGIPEALHGVVVRLVHACGRPEIVRDLAWRGDPVAAAKRAKTVFVDATMVAAGITRRPTRCMLNDPRVSARATALGTTRSAAAVDLWTDELAGATVAIGNAPTALFRLLEIMEAGAEPAAIFAFPVGFVGAAESKEALIASRTRAPFLTLRGRFGGSALAAAAINAL